MTHEERVQGLEVDVDTRLAGAWELVWQGEFRLAELIDGDDQLAAEVGSLLRFAYGRGYVDALSEESEGRRGELCRAHGYRLP